MEAATTPLLDGFDPTDPFVNENGTPHDRFRLLRATSPVHWVEQPPAARVGFSPEAGGGYFAVTRHADVSMVSRNAHDFSAWENTAVVRYNGPQHSRETVELTRVMLLNQDEPEHATLRRIVSRAFTRKGVDGLEAILAERASAIVRSAVEAGEGNFVEQVSTELPLQLIADLIGVPPEDRDRVFRWSDQMVVDADPDVQGDQAAAAAELVMYAMAMAADRKQNPRDDLVTRLVHADRDGRGLTDDEFGYFVILLSVAGNETTRNAITHGMNAFLDHPDQWQLWRRERPPSMVDEVIRWATPVSTFQRTALRDVEIGGVTVPRGRRVAMFYASANFDETVFQDPYTFDITRDPNPHVAFGGHGVHHCLGANLARREIWHLFNALADLAPHPEKLAEPRRLRHSWLNGVKELRVRYR